ncbi:hypothetical protein SADUNF_Sadunf13G0102400 [Salix dunnii]|uniref:mannan endo-1,4-beta-mannosidase n=1 Tax=Salix dunnii TaxID=1413687 RepID=A0A835MRI4_9ROSI|nr:hypothetical protein SADUNF_Sadunf13G0102400 [Salix dunnii]
MRMGAFCGSAWHVMGELTFGKRRSFEAMTRRRVSGVASDKTPPSILSPAGQDQRAQTRLLLLGLWHRTRYPLKDLSGCPGNWPLKAFPVKSESKVIYSIIMQKMVAGNGLLFPIFGFASCVAFIYMSFGDFILTNHREQRELSFVERNGTQFMVDGRAFYINGWNSYWLMDHSVDEDRKPRVSAVLEAGAKMGLTVCRTWAFNDGGYNALQVSPGRFDERVFRALDHVIAEARQHGIRLLLSLVNNLKAYGGKTQYVNWAWEEGIGLSSLNDSFFFDPSIKRYFKHYVKTLLTRKNTITGIEYRNDPTIFAWELMNEPRCISDPSGDTLQDWIEEMSAFVKTIDRNHLLTVGLEGFYGLKNPKRLAVNPELWASSLGSDFVRNSKVPAIDFASVHIYPDHWFPHLEFEDKLKYVSKWMLSHIEDGHYELNKPVFFTEFGLSNLNKDFQPSQRDRFYKTIFDIIYKSAKRKRAGAGALIWQLFVEGMDEFNDDFGCSFTVAEKTEAITSVKDKKACKKKKLYLCMVFYIQQWLEPAEVEAMEVLEASFTTTSLATEGELAANPINGSANDQTYFVKPYEDPDSRFSIKEAKILIKKLEFQNATWSKNLAVEKKILREIKASEKVVSLWSSLKEINNSIYSLRYRLCYPYRASAVGDKQILKQMKQLEIAKEKAIANASVKGKIWNSLGTKKALQEEFKIKHNELGNIKKEHLLLKHDIKKVEKELQKVEKDFISLLHQLAHLRRRKEEAYRQIALLQKE